MRSSRRSSIERVFAIPGLYARVWRPCCILEVEAYEPCIPTSAQFTLTFLTILTWSVVARALIGWLPIDQSSTVYQVLFRITEPVIDPIRRVLPSTGMLDLSPLAAILVLIVLQQMVIKLSEVN